MTDLKDKTVEELRCDSWMTADGKRHTSSNSFEEVVRRLEEAQQKIVAQQYELNHKRVSFEKAVLILSGIHALLYPPICIGPDGKGWAFNSPDVHALIQELSDRVRELPYKISELKSEYSEARDAEVAAKALEEESTRHSDEVAADLRIRAAEYRAEAGRKE